MNMPKRSKPNDLKAVLTSLNMAVGLGFVIALPPVLFAFLGVFLDKIFHTQPALTIIFIFLGIIAGIYSSFKEVKKFLKQVK